MKKAKTILLQLGGMKFIAMTGVKNFMYADVTEHNKTFWLRMDLPRNAGKVNRLKIYLNADDTYTMEFYHQKLNKDFDVVKTNIKRYEHVYCDKLTEIFTEVTGLDTNL